MLFRKAFSITLITQIIIYSIGIINTILIVRAIGPQGRGIYYYLLTSVSIISTLSSCGLFWSNTYWVGKEKKDAKYIILNGLYQALLVFLILIFIVYIAPNDFLEMIIDKIPKRLIYFSVVLIFFELGILHVNSVLLGLQDFKMYNFLPILRLILFTPLYLIFLYVLKMNVEGVIYSWFISIFITLVFYLVLLIKKLKIDKFKFNVSQFIKGLKIGSKALLANILGQLILRSDIFLINWFLGIEEVGYYSVSVTIAELLLKVPGIAGDILFPKVAGTNDLPTSINLITKVTRFIGVPLIFGALILIFWGKSILDIAFGSKFLKAYSPMVWNLFGTLVLSYHIILGNYFGGKGYPIITVWSPGITLIFNIMLNLLLIPKYGISGAAMSSCLAYILLTGIKLIAFKNKNNVSLKEFFILNSNDFHGVKKAFRLG